MGRTTHLHIEIKLNKWEHYSYINPDYDLSRMPIDINKGIPSDISGVTRHHYSWWQSSCHHPTYLNSEEVAALECWLRNNKVNPSDVFGWLFGNSFSSVYKGEIEGRSPKIKNFRFVLWFDN